MIRLWHTKTGKPTDFHPIDARDALATGDWLDKDPAPAEEPELQEPSLAEKLEDLTLPQLKDKAAGLGIDIPSRANKSDIIALIVVAVEAEAQRQAEAEEAENKGGAPQAENEE
jgi:hypothetical protein